MSELLKKVKESELEMLQLKIDEAELFEEPELVEAGFDDNSSIPQQIPEKFHKNVKDIDLLLVKILNLRMENNIYRQRFQDKKVFIECQVPGFLFNSNEIIYNKMLLRSKSDKVREWVFNQEYPQQLKLTDHNLNKITQSPILFKIHLEDKQENQTELGVGLFKIEKLLLEEGLCGRYSVRMENPDIVNQKKKQNNEHYIGELLIEVSLENSRALKNNRVVKFAKFDRASQQAANEIDFEQFQGQVLVYVDRFIQRTRDLMPDEQLFIRFKWYGSGEYIQSEPIQNLNEVNYRSILPVQDSNFRKLEKIPYIIEIWSRVLNDELIGVCKVNMNALFTSIWNSSTGRNNLVSLKNNLYPLIVYENEPVGVTNLKNEHFGHLNLTVAFGTTAQISRYEQKIHSLIQAKKQQQQIQNELQIQLQTQQTLLNYKQDVDDRVNQERMYQMQQRPLEERDNQQPYQRYQPGSSFHQQPQLQGQTRQKDGNQLSGKGSRAQQPDSQLTEKDRSNLERMGMTQSINQLEERPDLSSTDSFSANKAFVLVMENLRLVKRRAISELRNFVKQSESQQNKLTLKEFYQFLMNLPMSFVNKESVFQKMILVIDQENSGVIQTERFSKSFNAYTSYEELIRDNCSKIIQSFKGILRQNKWSVNDLDRLLLKYSEFGFIQKRRLIEQLESIRGIDDQLIMNLVELLDPNDEGLILSSLLGDYLRNAEAYAGLSYLVPEPKNFVNIVRSNIAEFIATQKEKVLDYAKDA